MKKQGHKLRLTKEDHVVNMIAGVIATVVLIVTVYPIYYSAIYSISDGQAAQATQIYFLPVSPTLENYKIVFSDSMLFNSYIMNILRTVTATITSVFLTVMTAYGITRKELRGRRVYSLLAVFTMYFSGGLIPTYLLLQSLNLLNTFWVYILPGMLSVYNMMLCMACSRDIPETLIESARLDGAQEFTILLRIIFPLSKPIIATIALFVGVGAWNDWYASAYYIYDQALMTLPTVLMRLVSATDAQQKMNALIQSSGVNVMNNQGPTPDAIRHATMLVSIIPIMCVYPFLQKYFVKGVMVGAIKA